MYMYSVCHIAGEMITALKMQCEKDTTIPDVAKIQEQDVLAVKLAALCHDLGN